MRVDVDGKVGKNLESCFFSWYLTLPRGSNSETFCFLLVSTVSQETHRHLNCSPPGSMSSTWLLVRFLLCVLVFKFDCRVSGHGFLWVYHV